MSELKITRWAEKPVVSKRMHVSSIRETVEFAASRIPISTDLATPEGQAVLHKAMVGLIDAVIRDFKWDIAKGAERGIEQVLNLMLDDDYYNTKRKQRQRAMERHAEQVREQKAARVQRLLDRPSATEKPQ